MKLLLLPPSDDFSKTDELHRKLIASAFSIPASMLVSTRDNRPIGEILAELNALIAKWQDIK